jgi:hypothetical protein
MLGSSESNPRQEERVARVSDYVHENAISRCINGSSAANETVKFHQTRVQGILLDFDRRFGSQSQVYMGTRDYHN